MIKAKYSAAITDKPWWLAGGIPSANCVAAYQPVGASDYLASKVNLANPGTYNAIAVASRAEPEWSVDGGWYRHSDSESDTLNTQVVPSYGYSVIVRFNGTGTDASDGDTVLGGSNTTAKYFEIWSRRSASGDNHNYFYGDALIYTGVRLSGIHTMAMTTEAGYLDGSFDVAVIGTLAGSTGYPIYLFTANRNGVALLAKYGFVGYIQALAIYNVTLTPAQVAALTNAMNAL